MTTHEERVRQSFSKQDVDPRSVRRWKHDLCRGGSAALQAVPASGRPPKLSSRQRQRLEKHLLKGAQAAGFATDLWTCPRVAELIEQAEIADVAGLAVLPGARALLAALPPDRYTIVTSGGRRLATTRLHAVGLPIPPTMITASDITRGKPDPQPYLAGAAALGFDPRTCLVFEDAPSGIRAAHAAGATVIALPTTYPQHELSNANAIIPSLAAVSATMDKAHNPPLRIEIDTPHQ